jgi:hypothetical protein
MLNLVTAFIDQYIEDEDFSEALRLKWLRLSMIEKGADHE